MFEKTCLFVLLLVGLRAEASSLPPHVQSFVKAYTSVQSGVLEGPALKDFTEESSEHYSQALTNFVAAMVTEFSKSKFNAGLVSSYIEANHNPGIARWSSILLMINRYFDESSSLLEQMTKLTPRQLAHGRRNLILFYADMVTSEKLPTKPAPVLPEAIATLLILGEMNVGPENKTTIGHSLARLHHLHPALVDQIQNLWVAAMEPTCP